ncbi:MAG: radical SAM/SPASM domain-containing protein [Clostridiales bacterium]|nr:radical SAM protein [Clostridiales bacterium]PWM40915.1 MAG: radical SAM/SPASM domain-containing protein [Clostridiales bacterium]
MSAVYRLRSCVWEITLACCFSCKYCGSKGGRARENELTTAECLDVAEQLAALGCRRVSLIGGEVFLRPDWETIVRALTGRGVRVAVITNGFRFAPEFVGRLRDAAVESVAVSIDGPREMHDEYRQRGSFDRALAAVDALAAGGIPVSVITTLHSRSAPLLGELYAVLREKPIFAWQIQACSPMGNAASGIEWRFDFGKVIRFVEDCLRDAPFLVGIADNIGYFTPGEGSLRGNPSGRAFFGGCQAGLTAIGIDSVGNVRGCESMYDDRFNEGNLREKRLADIWNDPNAFAYNRRFTPERLTGPCASCPYGSVCAGGCRSYNYFTHGKLYESPACARGVGVQ